MHNAYFIMGLLFFRLTYIHVESDLNPNSCLTGLKHDLRWLHNVDVKADPVLLGDDLTELIDLWQRDQGGWKRRIRRAARRHILQETIIQEAQQWHSDIFDVLRKAHYTFAPDPAMLHLQAQTYQCPDCPRSFATPQGVHTHRRKAHGVFCQEHHLLDSATCPACLTYLWSTQRLQQHLAYMPRDGSPNPCFAYLQTIGFAVSYAPEALPKAMRGQSRLDALPVAGPYGAFPTALQKERFDLLHKKAQLEEQCADYQQPDDPVRAGARIGDLLSAVTTQWYEDFCAGGRQLRVDDRLQDRWIDIIGCIPLEFES